MTANRGLPKERADSEIRGSMARQATMRSKSQRARLMKCPGCGAREVTALFQGRGFGPHACPRGAHVLSTVKGVCLSCLGKQESSEALFHMSSTVPTKPALPISCRLPEEGALIPHNMGPRPHTMASPRTLLTSQAPPAFQEWGVESLTSLENYLLACVLTCCSLSFLETAMGLLFCWGDTLWKAERGQGETRGKGAEMAEPDLLWLGL